MPAANEIFCFTLSSTKMPSRLLRIDEYITKLKGWFGFSAIAEI